MFELDTDPAISPELSTVGVHRPTQIAHNPLSVSDIGSGMGAILVVQLMPLDRILDGEISELVLDLFFNGMTSLLGDQLSYTHACLEILYYIIPKSPTNNTNS